MGTDVCHSTSDVTQKVCTQTRKIFIEFPNSWLQLGSILTLWAFGNKPADRICVPLFICPSVKSKNKNKKLLNHYKYSKAKAHQGQHIVTSPKEQSSCKSVAKINVTESNMSGVPKRSQFTPYLLKDRERHKD